MSKKKLTYQEIKKAAKKATQSQERFKRRKASDAHIPYQLPKTVFSNSDKP